MAEGYNVQNSLKDATRCPPRHDKDGCWQGVFMENVNAGMQGRALPGYFKRHDPLSPCDKVGDKYRHECYINHAGWLMVVAKDNIGKGTRYCLKAKPARYKSSCWQSIGLMVTNPVWQATLATDLAASPPRSLRPLCTVSRSRPQGLRRRRRRQHRELRPAQGDARARFLSRSLAASCRRTATADRPRPQRPHAGSAVIRKAAARSVTARSTASRARAWRHDDSARRDFRPPSSCSPVAAAEEEKVAARGGGNVVKFTDNGLEPSTLTIKSGDTVTFENDSSDDAWPASNVHPTHLLYPGFDAKKPFCPATPTRSPSRRLAAGGITTTWSRTCRARSSSSN